MVAATDRSIGQTSPEPLAALRMTATSDTDERERRGWALFVRGADRHSAQTQRELAFP
jgi:hypothetical protein